MDQNNTSQITATSQSGPIKKKAKLTWLLILQGWTMLCVVIGHSRLTRDWIADPNMHWLDKLGQSIAWECFEVGYSFRMPLFFMVSGYLFYKTRVAKNWKFFPMIKEKWIRLGIPYFFFIFVAILIKLVYSGGRPLDMSWLGLIHNFTRPFDGALQEMWFIAVILTYFLFFPLYKIILKSQLWTGITIMLGCGMYFISPDKVTTFLAINKGINYFIFFFMGLTVSKWGLEKYINNYWTLFVSMVIFTICTQYYVPLLRPVSGCLMFWGLATLIDRKITKNIFSSFRNYTYQIFLISIFGQILVKVLYQKFNFPGSYILWWIICIAVGVYVPVLIVKLIEKYNGPGYKHVRRLVGLGTK